MRATDQQMRTPTDQEDHAIIKQAIEDDSLLTEEQLASMQPIAEFPELQHLVKRGRPPKVQSKVSTTVRFDAEVLEFFRATGKGWQTRMNEVLRGYVASQQ